MPCGCAFTSSYTCSYLNILLAMTKVTIDTSWYNVFRCCDCQHTVDMDIITEKTRDCEQGVLVLFLSTEMSYGWCGISQLRFQFLSRPPQDSRPKTQWTWFHSFRFSIFPIACMSISCSMAECILQNSDLASHRGCCHCIVLSCLAPTAVAFARR